ncbi:MAG: TetR/AcrR family transcriptional regulator [Anaerolineaceae bacterium]|nr:TetR/AcrR family transcriptional regulator [Anaerolineaceae bacterium]
MNTMAASPNERRKSKTREDIIDTAHRMIIQGGLERLSLRALADGIDYSPAALYRYFDSKNDLIDSVRDRCFSRLNAYILRRVQSCVTAAEQLFQGGLAYIEYAAQHPADYHLMFQLEPSHVTRLENRDTTMQALIAIIQTGIETGEFKPREGYSSRTIAYHCWVTVHGLAMLQTTILQDEVKDVQIMSHQILKAVINGFT